MDYFIVVNGQKQGPFDLIGLIKKIKNGSLTSETVVSTAEDGPFTPAAQVGELQELLKDNAEAAATTHTTGREVKLSFKKYFVEGVDLWSRHVVLFSIIVGAIIGFTFFLGKGAERLLEKELLFVGNAIAMFFAVFFCTIFFYVVLLAKRSHRLDTKEMFSTIRAVIPSLVGVSLAISLISLASIFGPIIGLFAWMAAGLLLSYFVFIPFILFDSKKGLGRAAHLSFSRVAKAGADNFSIILLLSVLNVVLAFAPVVFTKELIGIGLFISLPITISAFAFVYDEIFG